jgi:hypothetical protein
MKTTWSAGRCEWVQEEAKAKGFVKGTVKSDEAIFKLNGSISRHSSVY